ncbi:MAG TPA: hypothetical protein VMT88_09475 [Actinomycetes bacterium]|nr:hypothetical protein [Actinomycetes bacterium]
MSEPSYAERILSDVRAAVAASPDGRLPLPDMADWDIFPFEGDLQIKALDEVVLPEPPREGEAGEVCNSCQRTDDEFIWTSANWRLTAISPAGLPAAVLLEPRAHHDLADLPPELAEEMGPILLRVEQAILSLGGIGRVHIDRWGDGGAHLHWWFLARPEGLLQLMGSFSSAWLDVLPPRPQDEWDATMSRVAAAMKASD